MYYRPFSLIFGTLLLVMLVMTSLPTTSQTAGVSETAKPSTRSVPNPQPSASGTGTATTSGVVAPLTDSLSLNVARRNHTATALSDGRVIIIGGDNQNGSVGEVEMLDAASHTLFVVAKLSTSRTRHTAIQLADGKVLVTGGTNQSGALNSTELFDPQTNSFSPGPRLQRARAGHSATLLEGGRVLIAGGREDDSAELFDPATNQSVLLKGKMTAIHKGHSAIQLADGNVLLVGGETGGGHKVENAEVFNAHTLSFSAVAKPLLIERAHPTLRLLPDGKVQVIGGDYDGTMEVYDPANGRFGAVAHLVPTADLFSPSDLLNAQTRAGFIDSISYRDESVKRVTSESVKGTVETFKQGIGRTRYATAEISGSNQAVVVGGVGDDKQLVSSALLLKSSPATISTDKVEYLPGDAPVISGSGWKPFEKITIIRQEARLGHKRRILHAVADRRGHFTCTDLTAEDYQVWVTYTLNARGESSEQIAQTSYIDAPLPGKEVESLPQPLKFQIPISTRDGSVETETVVLKWRTDSPYVEQEDFAVASTSATCTIPEGSTFNYNANFSSIIDQPCFGLPANPCGANDFRFKSACMSFSGSINAEFSVAPEFYLKFSMQEDFRGGGVLKLNLKNNLNLNLLNLPIPGLSLTAAVPGVTHVSASIGITVRAKLSTEVTTETGLEVPFSLSQGSEIGVDTRLPDPFFNNQTTESSGTGDITVTKPGTASAKVSLGPNVGVVVVAGIRLIDFGVGILGFVEPGLIDPVDTAVCKGGQRDLHLGIDGNATAFIREIGPNINRDLTFFSQQANGFPKPYFIQDTEPPTITGLTNITVPFDPGECGALVRDPQLMYNDACSGVDRNSIVIEPSSNTLFTFFEPGTTTVNVKVKDLAGNETSSSFTVTVTCPSFSIGTTTLPDGQIDTSYNQPLQMMPTNSAYDYSVSSGFLPPGLQINRTESSASIGGRPSQAGTFTFTITVSLCGGCSTSQTYTINIPCPTETFSLSPGTLPDGAVDVLYNQEITAGFTSGSVNYALTQGALPPGLSLQNSNPFTAKISGRPDLAGTYSFTVTATGFGSCGAARNYTIRIACGTVTLSNTPLPAGTAGTSYDQQIIVEEVGVYTMTVTSGTLPPGIQLGFNGRLGRFSGTPTRVGTYNFTVKATRADSCSGSRSYSITINCPTITLDTINATLPKGTAGSNYFGQFFISPTSNYTFDIIQGDLPPGLSVNPEHRSIEGTPQATGTWNFTLKVTSFGSCSASLNLNLTIDCPTVTLPSLPKGTVNQSYAQSIGVSGSSGAFTYGVAAGSLPPGLVLDPSTRMVKGKPTQPGTFNFTITASAFSGCTISQDYSLTIECPAITSVVSGGGIICPSGTGTVTVNVSGGTAPYTVTLTNSGGTQTGTSTQTVFTFPVSPAGTTTYQFSSGTDASGCPISGSGSATVTVSDTTPPTIACPANITKSTDANLCTAIVMFPAPTVSDNCSVGTPVCTPPSGAVFQKGTTTVNCTVQDGSKNVSNCSFTVTVNDTQKPSINCPGNISVATIANTCAAPVSFAPTASDNCAVASLVCNPPSGVSFPKGVTTVSCTATDSSGNPQVCSFTVTVNDTQPPSIVCPANQTRTAIRPGDLSVAVSFTAPQTTDNCAVASLVCVPPSGATFPVGITTVTCKATDTSANTTQCSFTVTVFDVCLQDDSNPGTALSYNSQTGDYRFCCNGTVYSGRGTIGRKGNVFTLTHNAADRRISATVDSGTYRGSSAIQSAAGTLLCAINDRDIRNNACSCAP
jgi:hypothetical protein